MSYNYEAFIIHFPQPLSYSLLKLKTFLSSLTLNTAIYILPVMWVQPHQTTGEIKLLKFYVHIAGEETAVFNVCTEERTYFTFSWINLLMLKILILNIIPNYSNQATFSIDFIIFVLWFLQY